MANEIQYVGARYVPKFANPVTWQSGKSYEALTIVTYNNDSYTSKVPVPANVGNPADNDEYWVLTGNYNGQVEQYRQETEGVKQQSANVEALLNNINSKNAFIVSAPENSDIADALNAALAKGNAVLDGKNYKASKPIVIPGDHSLRGNGSVIEYTGAKVPNDYVITMSNLNNPSILEWDTPSVLSGVTVVCHSNINGVKIDMEGTSLANVKVISAYQYGFYYTKYSNTYDCYAIHNRDTDAEYLARDTYGFYVNGNDDVFINCGTFFYTYGFYLTGDGAHYLLACHPLGETNQDNTECTEKSTAFYVKSSCSLVQCQNDNARYGVYIDGLARCMITDFYVWYYTNDQPTLKKYGIYNLNTQCRVNSYYGLTSRNDIVNITVNTSNQDFFENYSYSNIGFNVNTHYYNEDFINSVALNNRKPSPAYFNNATQYFLICCLYKGTDTRQTGAINTANIRTSSNGGVLNLTFINNGGRVVLVSQGVKYGDFACKIHVVKYDDDNYLLVGETSSFNQVSIELTGTNIKYFPNGGYSKTLEKLQDTITEYTA